MRSTWGSKREISPGVWELRYTIPGEGRKSETLRGTEKEADNQLAILRTRYCVREEFSQEITVKYLWEKLYWDTTKDLSPSTREGYDRYYKKHILPSFGNRIISTIKKHEVQKWLDAMTYGAAKSARANLRALFNFAEEEDLIEKNIMRKRYKMPKKIDSNTAQKHNARVYTEDEALAVLKDARGEQWEAAFILALGGGLRRSEAFSLKLAEIEFTAYNNMLFALIPICRSILVVDRELVIRDQNKTEGSSATVAIPEPYSIRLKEIVDNAPKSDVWLTDDGFGSPSMPTTIIDSYRRWFSRQPHIYVPFGNLRNSYSTIMHSKGLDFATISKMMRHANIKTDYKHYFRPQPTDIMDALSKLGEDGGENTPS